MVTDLRKKSMPVATFGSRLRQARRSLGMTLSQLMERTNIDEATLSRWENDTHEQHHGWALPKLSVALDVSVHWLLGMGEDGLEGEDLARLAVIRELSRSDRALLDVIIRAMRMRAPS